jgi:low temperature requirement protein LtrA
VAAASAPSSEGDPVGAEDQFPAGAAGAERRTTPIELLWDLVFAFAITRVTTLLLGNLSWRGFGHAMLILALVWWAWSAFVWVTNAHDPNSPAFRAVLLIATALIFVTGLAVPHAFGANATLFAASYAGVRMLHLGLYVDASRRGNASLGAIAGFAVSVPAGMALLLAGSFAEESLRVALWVAAAVIDYAGPAWLTRNRLRHLQRVAVAHFAERYSLFIIICLGESVVAIGVGASSRPLTAASVGAVFLALLITIALWWTYFDRFAAQAEERLRRHRDPVIAAADAYSYIHLVLVAGIIIFAVGARTTAAHADVALSTAERLSLCGGVAIYLVGHAAFRLRMAGRLHYPELAAAVGCLIVFATTSGFVAWAVAGLITLVLGLLVAWDSLIEGGRPEAR